MIEEYFKKQQKLQAIQKLQNEDQVELISSSILGKHGNCSDQCLEFQKRTVKLQTIEFEYEAMQLVTLSDCAFGLEQMIANKKINKKQTKQSSKINKYGRRPLSLKQQKYIKLYKELDSSFQIISGLFNVTLAQVRQNDLSQKKWLIEQASA